MIGLRGYLGWSTELISLGEGEEPGHDISICSSICCFKAHFILCIWKQANEHHRREAVLGHSLFLNNGPKQVPRREDKVRGIIQWQLLWEKSQLTMVCSTATSWARNGFCVFNTHPTPQPLHLFLFNVLVSVSLNLYTLLVVTILGQVFRNLHIMCKNCLVLFALNLPLAGFIWMSFTLAWEKAMKKCFNVYWQLLQILKTTSNKCFCPEGLQALCKYTAERQSCRFCIKWDLLIKLNWYIKECNFGLLITQLQIPFPGAVKTWDLLHKEIPAETSSRDRSFENHFETNL